MNLTLTIVHKTKKTSNLYYTAYNPNIDAWDAATDVCYQWRYSIPEVLRNYCGVYFLGIIMASFKSVPVSKKAVPVTAKSSGCLSTNSWGVSRRSGSGYVVFECPDSQVF